MLFGFRGLGHGTHAQIRFDRTTVRLFRYRCCTGNNWGEKAKRRKTTGSGRMRSLKLISRKFSNGFRVGTPKGARGTTSASSEK
ncbi:Hypothetical protein D9617_7g029360 [Elsinoe fawcettii]|nr:Hypothetical protein D9617_7g029360 [Elsinoe fawcettii]